MRFLGQAGEKLGLVAIVVCIGEGRAGGRNHQIASLVLWRRRLRIGGGLAIGQHGGHQRFAHFAQERFSQVLVAGAGREGELAVDRGNVLEHRAGDAQEVGSFSGGDALPGQQQENLIHSVLQAGGGIEGVIAEPLEEGSGGGAALDGSTGALFGARFFAG